ncbi:hypothetical protein GPALN_014459 [Globodera pallida]|nr:hypothetical protein GPALN_014459 [Globodera pallida]
MPIGRRSFPCRKCHLLALSLCLSLLCQRGSQIEADGAKMPVPSSLRRHNHQFGRPQHGVGHNSFRDDPNVAAAAAAAPTTPASYQPPPHQQSYAVAVPQAPQVAFDYGAAKPAAPASSSYSSESSPSSPGDENGAKGHQKNGTKPTNAPQALHMPAQNELEQRRLKRRCPRDIQVEYARNGTASVPNPTARITHRVMGQIAAAANGRPMPRVGGGARLHAATQFAARARPLAPKNTDTVFFSASEYEPVAAGGEQLPPPPPPPKPKSRGKYQRPGTTVAVVPSAAAPSNVPSLNNKSHEWAYIKKPKKQGARTRPPVAAPAPVQAVTPASGTALGGVFTALPPGVKGSHLQTISSKNLPSVNEAHRYYYPPRMPLPLPTCFHNPTGYPCCNPTLNDLMVETYTELESKPKFHTCNINAIALHLQVRAEERFNTSFETVAAFDDFAQKIHFYSDLVCKVELGGKYMLAYATVKDADRVLSTEQPAEPEQSNAIGSVTPNSAGGASRSGAGGGYAANLIRQKRAAAANPTAAFIGPLLPPAAGDLSRRYTMWI